MDGWPEGWTCFGAGGPNERFVSAGDRYVLYGEREGCRRAAWAIEGGAGAVDREALAKALLHAQHTAWGSPDAPWEGYKLAYRDSWLTVADEAIRLLGGAEARKERIFACPSCGPQDRCDEDGCCITHGQDLIEVAHEGAAYAVKEACDQLSADHDAALAKIEELERANATLTATANAAVARAEEAQFQAQRDEQDSETIALRAEVQRLRRALDRTAQGAAYLTDALSELTGGDHA